MGEKLNALAFGYAGAIISAACMLLGGILPIFGLYKGATNMMMQWQMFYSPSIFGIITGMIEAAVIGFIAVYAFAWVYNKFA